MAGAPRADVHDITLFGVEAHLPRLSPPLQGVDVRLEDLTVNWGTDRAVNDTVVCKQPGNCPWS